jgi:hypothetical protein
VDSLADVDRVIRAGWSELTCDPVDLPDWSPENPARGQCGVTALVVQDLLGGELLIAQVDTADGSPQGLHYWNRLAGGIELDLTREQFTGGELIGEPAVADRPADTSEGRLAAQYRALTDAVRLGLTRGET